MTEAKKYRIYGIVALIVLFLIGIFVGWTLDNGKKIHFKKIGMPEYKCDEIASQLLNAARSNNAQLVKELNEVYSQNCNRVVEVKPQQPQKQVVEKLPERDCEAIEQLLKEGLFDENTQNYEDHYNNANVYTKLASVACEENRDKYMEMAQRENKIANVLSGQMNINTD
ncbi:MAG: hypothetical protein MJ158_04545, partial [Alphaproteobacteria bacterium]|nr:hypothetical protein [Alphaproteobacteria bacterium]